MPIFRMKSENQLIKKKKSKKQLPQETAELKVPEEPVPQLPPITIFLKPKNRDRYPNFLSTSPSNKTLTSASSSSLTRTPSPSSIPSSSSSSKPNRKPSQIHKVKSHRRSRSFADLQGSSSSSSFPRCVTLDQPWRSRETWLALHSPRPISPVQLSPKIGDSGWRSRGKGSGGGGGFFGGRGINDISNSPSPSNTPRLPTSRRMVSVGNDLPTQSQKPRVTRSHTDGDLVSSLYGGISSRSSNRGLDVKEIKDVLPSSWTTGTAAALYRQKTLAKANLDIDEEVNILTETLRSSTYKSRLSSWEDTTPLNLKENSGTSSIRSRSITSSSEGHYPPTMISDRSTISSEHTLTEEPEVESESITEKNQPGSKNQTPPRPSVDVPSSPFPSPYPIHAELLPPLLPPGALGNKLSERKSSFKDLKDGSSPIPWAQASNNNGSPSRPSSRRGSPADPLPGITTTNLHTKSKSPSSSIPQTPVTPPTSYLPNHSTFADPSEIGLVPAGVSLEKPSLSINTYTNINNKSKTKLGSPATIGISKPLGTKRPNIPSRSTSAFNPNTNNNNNNNNNKSKQPITPLRSASTSAIHHLAIDSDIPLPSPGILGNRGTPVTPQRNISGYWNGSSMVTPTPTTTISVYGSDRSVSSSSRDSKISRGGWI